VATNFPSSLDSFTNPSASDAMDSVTVPHADQHANLNDAVEAVETSLLDGAPLHIDDANERVGIGTTTPSQTLDVRSANDNTSVFQHTTNGSDARIELRAPEAGGTSRAGQVFFDPDANFVGFRNGNINAIGVDSSGRVGVNDTTPSYQLDVDGDINATGDVRVAGNPVGLVLVKTINITNYTSWQPVTGCWSSTFKNYRIAITGGTTVGGFATLMKVTGAGSNHYSTTFYHTTGTTTSGTAAINAGTYCEVGGSGGTIFDLINVGDASENIYYASVSNDYTYFRSIGGKVLYTSIPTEIQFAYQGGTFLNATIEVYGYNEG